ncbi:MAG: phosphatidylglycerophosphatase A [Nitrospirota bacterium]|nr:phosphatidylglycerophosphatase A [Nitrospirota bacterium]
MNNTTEKPHTPADRLVLLLATGLGSGYAPKAPGTAGSLLALALAWPLMSLPLPVYLTVTALVAVTGTFIAGRAETLLGGKDHKSIVIDEVAGILVTLAAVPPTWQHLVLGFLLFRLFDISKPPPCRWAERRFKGGIGVMADDLMAGVYAALVLHLTTRLLDI